MKDERIILAPASLPQEQFLASDSTITLYAGSAGAGKTFALVLNMVKFADKPNSTIVCFRRTSTQIRAPGSVWQEASVIFKQMFPDARIKERDLEIVIPSRKSVVKFAHLQHLSDVNNHLGSQFSAIFYDETVTFDPFDLFVLPLLGRLRNAKVDYTPQMFWATNPKFGHGIYEWIKDFYLDTDGIPLKEKSNIERYFILKDNKPVWYNDKEEGLKEHGAALRSFRAIRAHVTDNIPLMTANPDYYYNLKALPDIKRRIFLDGSWTSREEESGYFKREFCTIVPYPNVLAGKRVRAWDFSAVKPSSASPDPDWTRGTLISKDKNSLYTVEDIKSLRDRPHEVEKLLFRTAKEDTDGTVQVIACDPGAAGIAYSNGLKMRLSEMGIICRVVKTNKSKLTRFLPVSAIAQAGFLQFVNADWTEEALIELENFNGEKNNGHDDIVDTISDGVLALNQGLEIPDFSLASVHHEASTIHQGYHSTSPQSQAFQSLPSFNL
jgi:predicted phage terminase large subunit-like protein